MYRADYHGGRWTLESQLKGDEGWARHDPLTPADWRMLREVLWRKYQRKRCPWGLIARIDRLLDGEAAGPGAGGEGGADD